MTKLGEYFLKKSINKADVARKTGLLKTRIGRLTLNDNARLTVEELYKIALAIEADPAEMLHFLCAEIKLK